MPKGVFIRRQETKDKIRQSKLGNTNMLGKKHTDEAKEKQRIAKLGKPSPRKGYKFTEEELKLHSEIRKGQIPWNKGIKTSDETIEKQRIAKLLYFSIEENRKKCPFYIDGRTRLKQEYCDQFTDEEFRNLIYTKDHNYCQGCGCTNQLSMKVFGQSLSIHHIDANKKNCSIDNLTLLCCVCHGKIRFIEDQKNDLKRDYQQAA